MFTRFHLPALFLLLSLLALGACGQKGPLTPAPRPAAQPAAEPPAESPQEDEVEGQNDE